MARNVALFGRRELEAHRRLVVGTTASVPAYRAVDSIGNKEWVVDVYLGPLISEIDLNIVRCVPIAPYAKNLVTDIRQPITMERSKEGKYTVIARSKTLASGAQAPDGSISEPTFHLREFNYATLGLTYIADLDYTLEELQADPGDELQADPGDPLQTIDAFNAFNNQVLGAGASSPNPVFNPTPSVVTTTRHTVLQMAKLGPKGDPDAMFFGTSELQPPKQKIIELVV